MTAIVLLLLILIAVNYAFTCSSNYDCELLGKCIDGTCKCSDGWKGPSCGTMDLGMVIYSIQYIQKSMCLYQAPNPHLGVWPLAGSHSAETTYSWGFTVVQSPTDNLYHAYVNTGCFDAANLSQPMVSGSFLLHLTSTSPTGPFKSEDITMPVTSFNPHILYSTRMKKYILWFRINELCDYQYCYGNDSAINDDDNKYSLNLQADTMDVAISDSPYGPWQVSVVTIANMPGTHISNPSAIELSNGTWILSYRFNTNAEYVGIAVSSGDYKGPFYNIYNLSVPGEDPFFWQSKVDDTFHIIFHVENAQHRSNWPSLHAYSSNLYDWNVSNSYLNFGQGAYSTNVTWNNGQTSTFLRRERPEIMFDANGKPLFFYSAVMEIGNPNTSHFGYSYSVVQSIA